MNNLTIEDYNHLSLENKIKFYKEIKPNQDYEPAIRQKRTKNIKKQGYHQKENGRLVFVEEIRRTDKKISNLFYLCKCDCGNWKIVKNNDFDNLGTISCGCYRKERGEKMLREIGTRDFLNIAGNIYGDLKAIEPINRGKNERLIWKCECIKCGRQQEVIGELLRRGSRYFCEYCNSERKSIGERTIQNILNDNNISYQREKSFHNCVYPDTNTKLRFDFFVNNTYLIEFDGEQHFHPVKFSNEINDTKALENFLSNQLRDNYKNSWCKENNIPLIRIPYTHKDIKIEDLKVETSDFLIK